MHLIRAVYMPARAWAHACMRACIVDGGLAAASNLAVTEQ